jgi:hypothetical protein
MRTLEIEAWVLRIADQVMQRQHVEDSLVELKSEWPAAVSAARQIAAHANAARGAPILWIIGMDEKRGVCGAGPQELANWFPSVCSQFNQLHPDLQDLNVRVGDETVVALLFQTERAPFVVKNPAFGTASGEPVELEVPWREGRKTRSARREDLVRMLAPLTVLPEIECLNCELTLRVENKNITDVDQSWFVNGSLYVIPSGTGPVVYPFHRCSLSVTLANGLTIGSWTNIRLSPLRRRRFLARPGEPISSSIDSLTVDASSTEVILTGPGQVELRASTKTPDMAEPTHTSASITLTLNAVGTTKPSVIFADLEPVTSTDKYFKAKWTFLSKAT